MNAIKRALSIAVFCLLPAVVFVACQKVVSIDLNKTAPQMVIEGTVTDQRGPYEVLLSKSGNYFEQSLSFSPVPNALVTVADNAGNADTLRAGSDGIYRSSTLTGTPGRTYTLKVVADGKEYDAVSTMPMKVPIDLIYTAPLRESDGDRGYYVYVTFKDPPQPGNYYSLSLHTTTEISDSITGQRYILYSDKLTNGNEANIRIRAGRKNLFPGDTLIVELLSIDESTYNYYTTLNAILSSDRSPTSLSPANPNTNLSNNSLGYFGAFTIDTKSIVLP
jgi:hypothetical protein